MVTTFAAPPTGGKRDTVLATIADQLGLNDLPHWWTRTEVGSPGEAARHSVSEGVVYANGLQLTGTLEIPSLGTFEMRHTTVEKVPPTPCRD